MQRDRNWTSCAVSYKNRTKSLRWGFVLSADEAVGEEADDA